MSKIPPYNEETQRQYANMGIEFTSFEHDIEGQTVFGVKKGNHETCNHAVLFIHGAPGNWQAWGQYFGDKDLYGKAKLIAIDRPGYGRSGSGHAVTNLKTHTHAIMQSVLKEHSGPFIVIGHSYGGPVLSLIHI